MPSVNTEAAAEDSAGTGITYTIKGNICAVESSLHTDQESNLSKTAQKFRGSLLHYPEDNDLGSEERRKIFKGMGLEGQARPPPALAQFLRSNVGSSTPDVGMTGLRCLLSSSVPLVFDTVSVCCLGMRTTPSVH